MSGTKEVIRFDDLKPYLLLQNGNFLYKVPFRDGWAVLKVFYGSRGTRGRLQKSFANVVLYGQTSYMPKTRCRIERECLDLWGRHGFRVFGVYDDVEVVAPGCIPGGYLLLEYVDRPKLVGLLRDPEADVEKKFDVYRRFLPEWSRRHDLAISERDPRLVHENGDGKHVMLLDDGGFLFFDFEMVWRSRAKIEDHVSHEIIQYLWQMLRAQPPEQKERFLDETIEHYPVRERLERAYEYLFRHPNLLKRAGRAVHRKIRPASRKPTSKYNVTKRLYEKLEAAR